MKNYQDKQSTPSIEFNYFDTILAIGAIFTAMSLAVFNA